MWLLLVAQQQYCECEKLTDLVEVLVFSTVDMRRANASTTLLLPPLMSSFAWVNSYSSGSTPAHAYQHTCDTPAYARMQQRSFEWTVKDIDASRNQEHTDSFGVKLEMFQQTWHGGGRAGGRLVHRAEKIEVEQRGASTRFRTRDGERGEKGYRQREREHRKAEVDICSGLD